MKVNFSNISPTTFRRILGRRRGLYRCCDVRPSSILCETLYSHKNVSIPLSCIQRRYLEGDFINYRTPPAGLCTRSGGTIGCPPAARKSICLAMKAECRILTCCTTGHKVLATGEALYCQERLLFREKIARPT